MKNNNFTIIHIIAAYMVLIGHQFVLMGQGPIMLCGLDIHGLGMRILFLVSGYLVSASYLRTGSPIRFILKRLSRLYPALIVCLIITIIFCRFITDAPEYYWNSALVYFLHNIEMRPKFDLAGVFVDNLYPFAVNGSLWTLPLELVCYLVLVPLLEIYKFLNKKSVFFAKIFLVIPLVCFSGIDYWRTTSGINLSVVFWDTEWMNIFALGTYFLVGILFQVLELKKICSMQVSVVLIILYMCLPPMIKYVLTPYVIGYYVLSFALEEKPLFNKYIKKDICYGVYLYAFPVQQLLIHFLMIKHAIYISTYLMMFFSVIVVTGMALLNYCLLEDRNWMKKLFDNKSV